MTGFDCSLHGEKREKRQLNKKRLQPLSVKKYKKQKSIQYSHLPSQPIWQKISEGII